MTYWHVELDRHDAVLAEGLACETYLDTGNRDAFENAAPAVQLHPVFGHGADAMDAWHERGCAAILTDPAQPALRALHLRLLARGKGGAGGIQLRAFEVDDAAGIRRHGRDLVEGA